MEIYTNQNIGKFYVKEGSHARTRHNKLVISFFGMDVVSLARAVIYK